jgi:hypothetical protein
MSSSSSSTKVLVRVPGSRRLKQRISVQEYEGRKYGSCNKLAEEKRKAADLLEGKYWEPERVELQECALCGAPRTDAPPFCGVMMRRRHVFQTFKYSE